MLKFKRIQNVELLKKYAKATQHHIGVLFPIEYLQRSYVFARMEKGSQSFQGGFVIVPNAPFRVITSLPEEVRAQHSFFTNVPENKICELTALWLTPEARKAGLSVRLWVRAYFEMLRTGKSHFVYSYSFRKTHLQKIFSTADPEILFRGETKMLPGMSAPEVESVEAISIRTMATVPFLKPRFFLDRVLTAPKPLDEASLAEEV